MPPTERKGRVHTSTVTVAVLPVPEPSQFRLRDADIEMRFTKDTGPGGQHRNKTESAVVLTHRPTGIQAKSADRCQHANRRQARAVLEARVAEHFSEIDRTRLDADRRRPVGSGERGDKIRTYCLQHDAVTDHRSARRTSAARVLEGRLELLR